MTRSDIVDLANALTERKAEKILPMMQIFGTTCQDICKRGRHWWRKGDVQFNITQNVSTYDFTTAGLFTPNLTDIAIEEIETIALILQPSPVQTFELTPIFDPMGIRAMKNNVQQGQPSRYTMDPNNWSILRVDPPDATYLAEMTCWLMPNLAKESASDVVPVIPPFYHDIIVAGMEARINKRVYGANDSRYVDSRESYEAAILTMMMRPQFTSNYSRQIITSEPSVQSTGRSSP